MGANIYEKHFTIDKTLPGPDHRMALNPNELKQTIKIIRDTELALGSYEKQVLVVENENRLKLRKSIVAKKKYQERWNLSKGNDCYQATWHWYPPC